MNLTEHQTGLCSFNTHCVKWKIVLSKIYSSSDVDSECWSNVDDFPPLQFLEKNCLNMKPDKNVESCHSGIGRSIAKIKVNLSTAMDENIPNPRVSNRCELRKTARWFYGWIC